MVRQVHDPTAVARTAYRSAQQESELVVAIFRTALILLAALATFQGGGHQRLEMGISIFTAFLYNLIMVILAWRRVHLRGQRQVMLLFDILLVTAWVYFTWGRGAEHMPSPLFPFYYLVVVIGAFWFGLAGSLTAASLISLLYLGLVLPLNGADAFTLVDTLYRQIIYVFLVAIAAGYMVDTHKREREQWTRTQVLLAQYQERFRAAQEMYELLVPAEIPPVPGLEIAARWRPALREGGGDFFDVLPLDDDRVVITIADVSGKSARGAMKLPVFKAAFLANARVWDSPGQVLSQVNRVVYPLLQPEMFISACVLILDLRNRRLLYANAGQDPPIFVREHTHETIRLETGGLVLGVDPQAEYPTEEQVLEPGDTLSLYTDGVTEARGPDGSEFGANNLEARVLSGVAIRLTADAIAENVFEAVQQHAYGERRHDDVTLLVIRYRPDVPVEVVAQAVGRASAAE